MKIQIIIGSTRPTRKGPMVAKAVYAIAKESDQFDDVEIVDIVDFDLPFLNEPKSANTGEYEYEYTKKWSKKITEADAYIFVTPEYNAGYPAGLKNAIDYLYHEWHDKPAGIVSYGGRSGGINSAGSLSKVLARVGIREVEEQVNIVKFTDQFDESKRLINDDYLRKISELLRLFSQ